MLPGSSPQSETLLVEYEPTHEVRLQANGKWLVVIHHTSEIDEDVSDFESEAEARAFIDRACPSSF